MPESIPDRPATSSVVAAALVLFLLVGGCCGLGVLGAISERQATRLAAAPPMNQGSLLLVADDADPARLEEAAGVLRQRLAALDLEARVEVEPGGRIRVEVPVEDLERVVGLCTAGGHLQFKVVAELDPDAARAEVARLEEAVRRGTYQEGAERYAVARQDEGGPLLLENPGVEGYLITEVSPIEDEQGNPAIAYTFGAEGEQAFYQLTSSNVERTLAVVLDDKVELLATIKEGIRGSGMFFKDGGYTPAEREQLLALIRSGRLPVSLSLESDPGE